MKGFVMAAPANASRQMYTLIAEQSVAGGAGETRLLNTSASYVGGRSYSALAKGDVIFLRAWGKYTAGVGGGTLRVRLYFNPDDDIASGLIADTGAATLVGGQTNCGWQF